MKPRMRKIETDNNKQQPQVIDKNTVFSITPSSGEFKPDASFEFEVTSSPAQVSEAN